MNTLSDKVVRRFQYYTRKDIADWRNAINLTNNITNPKFVQLQDIFSEISNDALLSSQISNRQEPILASKFELIGADEEVNDNETSKLRALPFMQDLILAMLNSELFGYSLIEFSIENSTPKMSLIPRRNIDPIFGRFYPDATGASFIEYRKSKEFGKYLVEFKADHVGILNKVVPHVLFKKYAQSCWSELCEIYGIPPRFLKTNTQDPEMLHRAETMLQDMGSAAAFVIDTNEDLSFASGVATDGGVYDNLINLCSNEISLVISGAIIGQDTQNGNYSKELSNVAILNRLINSDKTMLEGYFNTVIIPAFKKLGWISDQELKFRFSATEDNEGLWEKIQQILPYKDIDSDWLTEKFGIPIKDKPALNLDIDNSFFE